MKPSLLLILAFALLLLASNRSFGQLRITTNTNATDLAKKLVGEGVIISNASLTNNTISTGFFNNLGGTNIGMDSGIVLTDGRARTAFGFQIGLDGNGTSPANTIRADENLNLPGDADLALEMGLPVTDLHDAIALEFDFVPLGDSISFNYIVSSEEYTLATVCNFFDGFAFFISGPGITGKKNIALIPGTNTPVTIRNVNDIRTAPCVNNPQYYVDNTLNVFLTHEGHTKLFTASSKVTPCETYHLKLVIADKGDHAWDSGVFLEAGSLRSDIVKIDGQNPLNEVNNPYLAEGCSGGSIHLYRSGKKPYPQIINFQFGGTATNGTDISLIPSSATIPANDSVVVIPYSAIADLIPEGKEKLKIYISNTCSQVFSDSIEIEIRDIDMLPIAPADSIRICRNGSVDFEALPGFNTYDWTNSTTLSGNGTSKPTATPISASTNYVCTATTGTCIARDSVLVQWKTMSIANKTDILCNNGSNGSISVEGLGWESPVGFALNNGTYQAGNTFSDLRAGSYWVKMNDVSGCSDSLQVNLIQPAAMNLVANPTPASCSIVPDGQIEVTVSGGNGSYGFSSDGLSYQTNNILTVGEGTYSVYVKDANGCNASLTPVIVTKINNVTVDAGFDTFLCEGTSHIITATSNAVSVAWAPAVTLTNANTLTPVASPVETTKYYIIATLGTCTRSDSVTLNVWKAPVAMAGDDVSICYGITAQLNGSGGIEYAWTSNPDFVSAIDINNPVVKPNVTSTYYLNVKDINGCVSLQPDPVKVTVVPSVKIFAGNDTLVAINQPLQLHAVEVGNSGVRDWEWSPPRFFDNAFTPSPKAIFTSPVATAPYEYRYTVTGTTPEGCKGSDEIKIKVYQGPEIYVPSAFTPNGDGKNDRLTPVPVGIKDFRFFRVFDRWGQVIFQSQDPTGGWDGMLRSVPQQTGVYVWVAEGVDYTGKTVTRKGTTTLIK